MALVLALGAWPACSDDAGPEGRWVDFWDRSRTVDGPVDLPGEPAPLGHLPLVVLEGSRLVDRPVPDGS